MAWSDGLTTTLASPGQMGRDELPFRHGGKTYKLPIRYRIFAKPGDKGARRNFVAAGHVLMVTSNGQVHRHWSPQDFRQNTKQLTKLADRILATVEVDALPIEMRSQLFTADRAQFVQSPDAVRLEQEISAFLDDWPALREANAALIREQITGGGASRSTIGVAERIARAFKSKGFSLGGSGSSGGSRPTPPRPKHPEDLYDNPTHFEGPGEVQAKVDAVKSVYLHLNAKNDFIPGRAMIQVTCDHPGIGDDEITIGDLEGGLIRVSLAVPDNADLGDFTITAVIPEWTRTSGGLGPEFRWQVSLKVIAETPPPKPSGKSGGGKRKGKSGAESGGLVALIWTDHEDMDEWRPNTVGTLEMVAAVDLAARSPADYKDLAGMSGDVPTIFLNRKYAPLKAYIAARSKELTKDGAGQACDRYAVGAGVAVLTLHDKQEKAKEAGRRLGDDVVDDALDTAARSVLSVLPEADRILKELE